MTHSVVLLTGPTASGKSALAMALAHRLESEGGAAIINADSMQVYRELRIVTARPTTDDEAAVPHRLYGVLPATNPWSVAAFCEQARVAIETERAAGRLPIVVGGTGLYLRALVDGLAEVPAIPDTVRDEAREMMEALGPEAFHQRLAVRDPEMAERLRSSDPQRMTRAWEVIEATGRSLAEWQRDPPAPGLGREACLRVAVEVPRETLYARIDARFAAMVEGGAVEEVERLLALDLPAALPAMRAVGVPQIAAYLRGEMSRDEMIALGSQATRHLAKRQGTWQRNQMSDWLLITQDSKNAVKEIFAKIRP